MTRLTMTDVGVRYSQRETPALLAHSGTVEPGQWLGLIGPNGAGKSSLLKAIVGLVGHTGEIEADGVPLGSLSDRERAAQVAYVAQDPLIPDDMTGREYTLLGRTPYIGYFGSPSRRDRLIVDEVLERGVRPAARLQRDVARRGGGGGDEEGHRADAHLVAHVVLSSRGVETWRR